MAGDHAIEFMCRQCSWSLFMNLKHLVCLLPVTLMDYIPTSPLWSSSSKLWWKTSTHGPCVCWTSYWYALCHNLNIKRNGRSASRVLQLFLIEVDGFRFQFVRMMGDVLRCVLHLRMEYRTILIYSEANPQSISNWWGWSIWGRHLHNAIIF